MQNIFIIKCQVVSFGFNSRASNDERSTIAGIQRNEAAACWIFGASPTKKVSFGIRTELNGTETMVGEGVNALVIVKSSIRNCIHGAPNANMVVMRNWRIDSIAKDFALSSLRILEILTVLGTLIGRIQVIRSIQVSNNGNSKQTVLRFVQGAFDVKAILVSHMIVISSQSICPVLLLEFVGGFIGLKDGSDCCAVSCAWIDLDEIAIVTSGISK
mmetsp:Transcript_19383/g.53289  ORF Transcript_19383/g.53289 Transcript_19383/m.53289 type:complete len:215 (-) Transcript_19383:500-1144(-)